MHHVTGTQLYGGKIHDRRDVVKELCLYFTLASDTSIHILFERCYKEHTVPCVSPAGKQRILDDVEAFKKGEGLPYYVMATYWYQCLRTGIEGADSQVAT